MELSPDGSLIENCGYVADGSGSIFVKPILQNEYKENMSQKEAIDLIEKCYKTSFKNDSGSGDGYIILDVTKKGTSEVVNKSLEVKK